MDSRSAGSIQPSKVLAIPASKAFTLPASKAMTLPASKPASKALAVPDFSVSTVRFSKLIQYIEIICGFSGTEFQYFFSDKVNSK
jgi:hypothetical protein